jgi:drug/metabolite transporter (DMT)-like permease
MRRFFDRSFDNAYLVLVIAPLMWGGNAVAGRFAAGEWQPFTITCVRWLCALVLLFPFAWGPLKKDWPVIKDNWLILLLLGMLGMSGFSMLMFWSLNYTTAINVSIEQASMPVLIMLANFFIMSQRVRWLQIVGLLMTLFGVLITATAGEPLLFFSEGLNRGDAIMLLACVFYAGYTFGLRWRPNIHWLSFLSVIAAGSLIMTAPFAAWELSQEPFVLPGTKGWLVLLYIIIFPTIVGQICYARGVQLLGSNRAGLFVNLVPIFGSVLAVLLLGESFRWFHFLGLTLVLAGIGMAERAADKSSP